MKISRYGFLVLLLVSNHSWGAGFEGISSTKLGKAAGFGTIPSSHISGLGTMSTQNANAVAITGGTIDVSAVTVTAPVQAQARLKGTRLANDSNSFGNLEFFNTATTLGGAVLAKISALQQDNIKNNARLVFFTTSGNPTAEGVLTEQMTITDVGQVGIGMAGNATASRLQVNGRISSIVSTDSVGSSESAVMAFGAIGGPDHIAFRRTTTGNNFAVDRWNGTAWVTPLTISTENLVLGTGTGVLLPDANTVLTSSMTNAVDKAVRLNVKHYTNAEEPMAVISGYSSVANNFVGIGGGHAGQNAATQIDFYAAANNITTTGTSVITVNSANTAFATPIKLKGYTVATLPAGTQGLKAFVTDAIAPTFLGALTGGGTVVTPVFHNGTSWVAG